MLDWFLLTGGGCNANACVGYTWENVKGDPKCGGGNGTTCSYLEFPVSEGQVFYLVGDLFNGAGSAQGYPYNTDWNIEIQCDASEQLLLNEDFTDSVCNGCSVSTNAGPQCQNFGWHTIGGFADVVTGLYAGQIQDSTLLGYDCGAASTEFPSDGGAARQRDFVSIDLRPLHGTGPGGQWQLRQRSPHRGSGCGNGPSTPLSGTPCGAAGADQNPYPSSTGAGVVEMAFDLTDFPGDLSLCPLRSAVMQTTTRGWVRLSTFR